MSDAPDRSSLKAMVYASMFGALTALGALITIPFQPVPLTLQTLFTGLSGVLLGPRGAVLSQVVYVLLGLIGLPVFSGGKAGLGVLLGPTGGYLIGFIAGAFAIGQLIKLKTNPGVLWIGFSLVLGTLVIYSLGILQLTLVAHLTPGKALMVGVIPFIPGDLVKILAAALISVKLKKYILL